MGKTVKVTLGADVPLVIDLVKWNDGQPLPLIVSNVNGLEVALVSYKGEREVLEWKEYGSSRIIAVYRTRQTGAYALEITGQHDGLRIASREPTVVKVTFYNEHDGEAGGKDGYYVETAVDVYDDPGTGTEEKIAAALERFFLEVTEEEMDKMIEEGSWREGQFYYTVEEG